MSLKLGLQWQFYFKYLGSNISGSAKRKNNGQSLLKENNKDFDFDLMYGAEHHLFNQKDPQ